MNRHFTLMHTLSSKDNNQVSKKMKNGEKLEPKKREFYCGICEGSFMRKENLNRHMSQIHEGKKPFKCSVCERTFTMKHTLKKHFDNLHEKRISI